MTSATAEHATPTDAGSNASDHDGAHGHPTDTNYWQIFGILVLITAFEVYLSYAEWVGKAFLPLLLGAMAVKFVMVVSFFMHLRFDHKLFGLVFYSGLVLAIAVYIAFLTTTEFWVD